MIVHTRISYILNLFFPFWCFFPDISLWDSNKGGHHTNVLWAPDPNLNIACCSYMKNDDAIRSQLCTCHDSWAVMTCANLWPDSIHKILTNTKKNSKDFNNALLNCLCNGPRTIQIYTRSPPCVIRVCWVSATSGRSLSPRFDLTTKSPGNHSWGHIEFTLFPYAWFRVSLKKHIMIFEKHLYCKQHCKYILVKILKIISMNLNYTNSDLIMKIFQSCGNFRAFYISNCPYRTKKKATWWSIVDISWSLTPQSDSNHPGDLPSWTQFTHAGNHTPDSITIVRRWRWIYQLIKKKYHLIKKKKCVAHIPASLAHGLFTSLRPRDAYMRQ